MTDDEGKIFQRVLSVAQTLLQADRENGMVTPALISEQVEVAAMVVARGADIDKKAAVAELIRRFSLWIGKDSSSENYGHFVAGQRKLSILSGTYGKCGRISSGDIGDKSVVVRCRKNSMC